MDPSLRDLRAEAKRAADRLALYRRRVYVGRGSSQRLVELIRIADGARKRLLTAQRLAARHRSPPP